MSTLAANIVRARVICFSFLKNCLMLNGELKEESITKVKYCFKKKKKLRRVIYD